MAWELNENHKHNQSYNIFFFNHFLTLIFFGCIMEIALRKWKILLLLIIRAKLFHKMVASYYCMSDQSIGEIWKHAQTFSYLFLKILKEGAVMTEAGSLFLYFTTLTTRKDSDSHL